MKSIFYLLFLLSFSISYSQSFPKIDLETLNGETINVYDLSNTDDIKIFSFWATWCAPCINELDAISDVYDEWQEDTNVEIIAVATDDSRTNKRVRPMVNGKGWEYKVLLDENQDLKRALNITTIPHVVMVKNGEIIHRHTGYTPGSESELLEIVKKNQ